MGKPLSWKWKAVIACLFLVLFLIGWMFSASGHAWMKAKIIEKFEEMPPPEQRDSAYADRWLALAWWSANIRGEYKEAMGMYEQFCGLGRDKEGLDFTKNGGKLVGLCSPDGQTGWGPMHPRAPEAHYAMIEIMDFKTNTSGQYMAQEYMRYFRAFYNWMIVNSPERKPHPMFSTYWAKIRERVAMKPIRWESDIDFRAPLAPPPPKDGD
ncbi:MAG: hypothetical protein NTW87_33735 [Planctomycetota bacterium]|nr:hypothetical protein [Planctomycetota bacterium]